MKIVHLSLEDSFGAGRAAIRISNAVSKTGVDSSVRVLNKNEMADSYALGLSRTDRLKVMAYDRFNHMLLNKYPEHGYFHVDKYGIDLTKYPEIRNADLLHFHWINEGIWSRSFVQSLISLNKPIVWTMHDMWPFTGGCHYDDGCGKYKGSCTECPVLCSQKRNDDARKAQKLKQGWMEKLNVQLVGCSHWITDQANESDICSGIKRKAVCIPNPADERAFQLYDKALCKKLLEINESKKLVLFGAVNAASDQRKGAGYLLKAIEMLDPKKYILGIFGSKEVDLGTKQFEIVNFGRISDDFHLSLIYNAADVFVAPSMQENLANTVMESLTCGTPVAAFDVGGMPDMIVHGENGYLAKPFEISDLSKGIEFAGNISGTREAIRQLTLEKFSEDRIGKAYLEVYKRLVEAKESHQEKLVRYK